MTRVLTLADGRLGLSAAALLTGAEDVVALSATNVGVGAATVTLTFSRAGGTARRLARVALAVGESLELKGLPVQPDDVLYGQATATDTVDYVVTGRSGEGLAVTVLDANGARKVT